MVNFVALYAFMDTSFEWFRDFSRQNHAEYMYSFVHLKVTHSPLVVHMQMFAT